MTHTFDIFAAWLNSYKKVFDISIEQWYSYTGCNEQESRVSTLTLAHKVTSGSYRK